jgi:hypothetical protein
MAMFGMVAGPGRALAARKTHRFSTVKRSFDDPYLELIRLLKEGPKIEHDLMVQYLYSAYALKSEYAEIVGGEITANHVGKLYDAVITTLAELKQVGDLNLDFNALFQEIGDVKAEGEFGHFKFFHSLYEASHPLIKNTPDIWSLPASDARYPSYDVPINPTAYDGRPTSIEDTDLRALAWLGNMNYWSMLLMLDSAYRSSSAPEVALAQAIMMGPLNSIARYLPTKGSAVPFDPLSLGFNPGLNAAANKRVTHLMLQETRDFARSIEHLLPADFNIQMYDQLLNEV